jgi:von Willebrand factor type A domain
MRLWSLLTTLPIAVLMAATAHATTQQANQKVEVAFVLDTTGSMGDLIDGAKRKIWSIASTVVETNPNADISMALVAYRDRGDDYILQTTPLSEDIQGLYGKLVKLQADGGDDTPESVNAALNEAINKLHWTSGPNVKRIVFLVGDAPPHMDYKQERQYPAIMKDAIEHDIVVNAVQAGDMPETTEIWKEIAQFGHGRYIAIPQNGGEVSIIITPFDDDILHLQMELDRSVLPYGTKDKKAEISTKMSEKAAAPSSVQIENSKYYSKRALTKEVITGGGDLIADLRNDKIKLDAIDDKEMPEELLAKPKAERQVWIDAKLDERSKLENHMAALIAKRDAFVQVEQKKTAATDSFDRAIEDTLRSQLN